MRAHLSQQRETVHAKITVKPTIKAMAGDKLGHLSWVTRNFRYIGEIEACFGVRMRRKFMFKLANETLYAPLR